MLADELDEVVHRVVEATEARRKADVADATSSFEKAAGLTDNIGKVVGAIVVVGTVFSSVVIGYMELREKPSEKQLLDAIETHAGEGAHPEAAHGIDENHKAIEEVDRKLDRVIEVVEYQIEYDAWRDKVVDHRISRSKGPLPGKPPSLKMRENKLLGPER